MEQQGARVLVAAVDVADRAQLAALLAVVEREWPPLAGLFHAAGVVDDGIVLQQSWERMAHVLAPKLQGAWNLHQLTQQAPLDFFVCFSGLAGWRGAAGQTPYAAANRFLPALAFMRRAQGLPALTIDWSAWSGVGMAAALDGGDYRRWTRQGLGVIDPAAGMEALHLAVRLGAQLGLPHVAVSPRIDSHAPAAATAAANGRGAGQPPAQPGGMRRLDLPARYQQTPPSLQRKLLVEHVVEQAARTIGLGREQQIDAGQPLHDIGLDSLMAVELRNLLGAACGVTLPATLLFDYPTAEAVADYLQRHVPALAAAHAPGAGASQPQTAAAPGAAAVSSAAPAAVDEQAIADLSDAEAEALLLVELAALSQGR